VVGEDTGDARWRVEELRSAWSREATVRESRDSPVMDAFTSAGESLKVPEMVSSAVAS